MRRLRGRQGGARAARDHQLLLEGPHLLSAALDAGLELQEVLLTQEFAAQHPDLLDLVPENLMYFVESSLLAESADTDTPQGLVALATSVERSLSDVALAGVVAPPSSAPPSAVPANIGNAALAGPGKVVVYLDGLQDPGNLGAVARSAEAFGASSVFLAPNSVRWRHPRALRASAGALLRLPVFQSVQAGDLDAWLNRDLASQPTEPLNPEAAATESNDQDGGAEPPRWLVLDADGDVRLSDVEPAAHRVSVLVIGSESHGPGDALEDLEGLREAGRLHRVSIEVSDAVESLNAAVAGALALYVLRSR